jgi:hypothetical protein
MATVLHFTHLTRYSIRPGERVRVAKRVLFRKETYRAAEYKLDRACCCMKRGWQMNGMELKTGMNGL